MATTVEALDHAPLEVDTDPEFSSSDYSSSLESSTHSITSSIVDYVYENGRRYHRLQEGKYLLPNDETEQDRLDMYHHLQLLLLKGALFVAPIGDNPQHILDCGTGTGIWALDAGELYPMAEVVGVDLSPIQPEWVVPNVRFEVDDLEMDWTFRKDYFDFIHSRNVAQSIRDWPKYLEQMYRHTKPGGYVELAEIGLHSYCDDNSYKGSALETYIVSFVKAIEIASLMQPTGDALKKIVEAAGFVDVTIKQFKQPWGGWPKNSEMKRAGFIVSLNSATGFESYGMAPMTRFLGLSTDEVLTMCKNAQADVESRKVHAYQVMWHVLGRKPEKVRK
ncbi:S-adenosyl-L-methionine-dependent methyltransferase [Tricharina praecox]|uniref:S-adenosyl-L-methionine-dependent methyltransferase n=1 Tax=Tricharina praecox TaxID=43433 RepID=UPI00222017FC|nr:S-adenosyl-L-methionine-dependent methyltransferase [Tricharina praecox]KAI5842267.1 S-adenosyl-L-methionine-dependent methyltransferase [Tricharina praecox]